MVNGVQAYLILQKAFQQKRIGPMRVVNRRVEALSSLSLSQQELLNGGHMLKDDDIKRLAVMISCNEDEIREELSKFLSWWRESMPLFLKRSGFDAPKE